MIHSLFWKNTKDKNLSFLSIAFAQFFNEFRYATSTHVFTKGATISTLTPIYAGSIYDCLSSPNLPAGLILDSSCAISGTPTSVQEISDYTITAFGSNGKVNTILNITVRGLNTYKFSSSTDRTGNTNINCSTQDEATGIGPFSFNIPYDEDVLVTLTSNLRGPPAAWPTGGGHLNPIQLRLYIDGIMQQSLVDGRFYHQDTALGSAFITSMKKGDHSMELRYCGNNTYYPLILGAYQTILTATSLMSISYFDKKFSYQLSGGSTTLPASGSFTNILNGTDPMALTYNTSNDPVLLWQTLALAGGVGVYGLTENFRLSPETSEDLSLSVDSYSPINKVTYHTLAANSSTTINAQYSGLSTGSLPTVSNYDNTLNLIGFKVPSNGNYGKSVISSLVQTNSATFVPLTTLNITNSYDAKYLVSFSANNAQGNSAGDTGCIFGLTINGGAVIAQTLVDNDAGGSLRSGTIITVETIPAGTIPVQIQYKEYAPTSGCNVNNAVFTILPLE